MPGSPASACASDMRSHARVVSDIDQAAPSCPALHGMVVRRGSELLARTADAEWRVQAPVAWLDYLILQCDGMRPLSDILAHLPRRIPPESFARMVSALLENGMLVEGRHFMLGALRYGHQMSPYGLPAPIHVTNGISRDRSTRGGSLNGISLLPSVDTPLSEFFDQRISAATFDEVGIAESQLATLLWSLCGVVTENHARLGAHVAKRTIASAGAMHLLQVYLLLRRSIGPHAEGVYRVTYPAPRQVALERIGPLAQPHLCRAFQQPWHVESADGVVALMADAGAAAARYRNRAIQYLFMEAGAALHNGALSAAGAGVAYLPLGCYDEGHLKALCQDTENHQIVLGAAAFGARPTNPSKLAPTQMSLAALHAEFCWMDNATVSPAAGDQFSSPIISPAPSDALPAELSAGLPEYRLPYSLARVVRHGPGGTVNHAPDPAWGYDADAMTACRKAWSEAVERQGFETPGELSEGVFNANEGMHHAEIFIRYRNIQYQQRGFPFTRLAHDKLYRWKVVNAYDTGAPQWVPADLVHAHPALNALPALAKAGGTLTYATTSGCAAALIQEDAIRHALYETVEHDAFMRHWLWQQCGIPFVLDTLPAELWHRVQRLQDAGNSIGMQFLPSPWAAVVLVSAQHDHFTFTTVATAARASLEAATEAALSELEPRVYAMLQSDTRTHGQRLPLLRDVRVPADHFRLYAHRPYYRRANAVLHPHRAEKSFSEVTKQATAMVGGLNTPLAQRLCARGLVPLIADITPRHCVVPPGNTALQVVKVLVPTFVPLSFGFRLEPRGMVDFMHPCAAFPHPLS